MSYRMDTRTKEEFKKQIKNFSKVELDIILRFCLALSDPCLIKANGCDFSGKLLDDKNVNSNADFAVNNNLIEVAHSKGFCKKHFHLKVGKVKSLIKQNANVLFVNGYKTDKPKFILINTDELKHITQNAQVATMPNAFGCSTGKPAYRISLEKADWKDLPSIPNGIKKITEVLIES